MMLTDSRTLAAALAAVLPAASRDEFRPHLSALYLERCEDVDGLPALRVVGTDGHRLHAAELNLPTGGEAPPVGWTMLLSRGAAERLAKGLKAAAPRKRDEAPAVHVDGVTFTAGSVRVDVETLDETFPPYRKVIPGLVAGETGAAPSVAVNARYMVEACKAAGIFGDDRNGAVHVQHGGPLDPFRVTSESVESGARFIAVVMPMRADAPAAERDPWAVRLAAVTEGAGQ